MQQCILIVDANKPSLVMTSEACKDKVTGAIIHVAETGKDCMEIASRLQPDLIILDFDLPDADGVSLTRALREFYPGPILMTAFREAIVEEAVATELFAYNDSTDWVPKPVRSDELFLRLETYLTAKKRIRKRFAAKIAVILTGKGAGRGKRAPKMKGNLVSLSLLGGLMRSEEAPQIKMGEEVTVIFHVPSGPEAGAGEALPLLSKGSLRLQCRVLWVDKNKRDIGLRFMSVNEATTKVLESIMRDSPELPLDPWPLKAKGA